VGPESLNSSLSVEKKRVVSATNNNVNNALKISLLYDQDDDGGDDDDDDDDASPVDSNREPLKSVRRSTIELIYFTALIN